MRTKLLNAVLPLAMVLVATRARSQTVAPDVLNLTGPPKVVDSLGQVIGIFYAQEGDATPADIALVRLIGRTFSLDVTSLGFFEWDTDAFHFYHLTTDCSGDRYSLVSAPGPPGFVLGPSLTERSGTLHTVNNKTLWTAQLPLGEFTALSLETFPKNADLSEPGICNSAVTPFTGGLLTSVSLARFVPPFKVAP